MTVNAFYKHSRIKQYLKDGRALRIETVVNSPDDLRCHRRLEHLPELQSKARDINARLLDTERVGQGRVLANPAFERVALPTLTADGKRAPALRFGDPRVMALLGALCVSLTALGFTHRSLRARVNHLLGIGHSANQMSYDLARLRRNGLIERRPHTNTPTSSPLMGYVSHCSTPRSTTGSCAPSSQQTKPPHRHHCAKPWQPSTATSTATSTTPG
ncbi:hypothetical protein [Arthrobacter sp. 24S4-2]|uniref:hypothetical protein n=1 Tax=Arthrobacter sp. 24S4-2 TaxID=2575374 RepID=UPI001C2F60D4|nr:hypothetical protein [Arthrobacter sp. 24S4-2]